MEEVPVRGRPRERTWVLRKGFEATMIAVVCSWHSGQVVGQRRGFALEGVWWDI